MLTEIYIEALLVDEELADQVHAAMRLQTPGLLYQKALSGPDSEKKEGLIRSIVEMGFT